MARLSRAESAKLGAAIAVIANAGILGAFTPNPGGQEQFCESKAYERFLLGGNSSGKTYTGLVTDAQNIIPEKDNQGKPTGYTINPYRRQRIPRGGILGWISSYSQDVQRDNIDPLFYRILGKYIKKGYKEKGVYHWAEFESGKINFKWNTQDMKGQMGAKIHFCHCDEPHPEGIYGEIVARTVAKKGFVWSTLTPIADFRKSAMRASEILWYKKKIIDPWLRYGEERYPHRGVFFVDVAENYRFIDVDHIRQMFSFMSEEEYRVRTTGMPYEFYGDNFFNVQLIGELEKYLLQNLEFSQPECGKFIKEAMGGEDQLRFVPSPMDFPHEPDVGWAIKVWEHPIERQLGVRPNYAIGVDVSQGIEGRDYSAVYVTRLDTGGMVAALHGYLDPMELSRQIWNLGWYYFNYDIKRDETLPALLAVEIQTGSAMIPYLLYGNSDLNIEKYDRRSLYRRPALPDLKLGLHIPSDEIGWSTTSGHRPFLLSAMRSKLEQSVALIRDGQEPLIRDIGWVSEAKVFIMDQNMKYQAAPGFHDDRLFALSISDMGMLQGQYTAPRHEIPERPEVNDKVMYIDPDFWKHPDKYKNKMPPIVVDRETARQLAAKRDKPKVQWI